MNFLSLLKRNFLFRLKSKINIDKDNISNNSSLDSLFSNYKTDKAEIIDNNQTHGFSKFYEKHLKHLKKENLNILEIGSYSGSSAAAFVKYFPNSKIYCLDVNLLNFKYSSKKIFPFGIDSSNKKMLKSFLKKIDFFEKIKFFDFIIDDGSHILSDQLFSLNFFYKYVKSKGFYIIEDYKFSEYFDHCNDVSDINIQELIDNLNNKNLFLSNIIENETITNINKSLKKIYTYKGNTKISDIAFFEKS